MKKLMLLNIGGKGVSRKMLLTILISEKTNMGMECLIFTTQMMS